MQQIYIFFNYCLILKMQAYAQVGHYIKSLKALPSQKAIFILGKSPKIQLKAAEDLIKDNCKQISWSQHEKQYQNTIYLPQIKLIEHSKQSGESQQVCIISVCHQKQFMQKILTRVLWNYLTHKFQNIHVVIILQVQENLLDLNASVEEILEYYWPSIDKFVQNEGLSGFLMDEDLRESIIQFQEVQQDLSNQNIQGLKILSIMNKNGKVYQFQESNFETIFECLVTTNQSFIKTAQLTNKVCLNKQDQKQKLADYIVKQLKQILQEFNQHYQPLKQLLQKLNKSQQLQSLLNVLKEECQNLLQTISENQEKQIKFQIIDERINFIHFISHEIDMPKTINEAKVLSQISQQLTKMHTKIKQQDLNTSNSSFKSGNSVRKSANKKSRELNSYMNSNIAQLYRKKYQVLLKSYTEITDQKFSEIIQLPNRILKFDLLHRILKKYKKNPLEQIERVKLILFFMSKILRNYHLYQSSIKILMIIPDFNGIERDFDEAAKTDMEAILQDKKDRCLSKQFVEILQQFCNKRLRRNIAVKCNNYLLALNSKQQKLQRFILNNDDDLIDSFKHMKTQERYLNFNYHPQINILSDNFRQQILKKVFMIEKTGIDVVSYYTGK